MPKVDAGRLGEIGRELFIAAGTPPAEAETVMRHVIAANLAGHDSHGIIQVPTYLERIKLGHIVPGAPWQIVRESPTTTVVDGHWGFGYVANERAMKLTIEKAKAANLAAATVFRQGHIGRVASYTLMAAKEGMIGIATADSGRSPKAVAPFGGREARLGTNPISIAMPSDLDGPLYLDMATSAAAAGKIALSVARGTPVPPGWIIDKDGRPTTDPAQLRQGGALLPVGGSEGYKGYGLSVMVEILCGLLTGLGFGVEPTGRHNDGCFMAVFKVEAFRPLAEFKKDIGDFVKYLKATKPAEGSPGVYYPGELEHLREVDRAQNGIEVEDATWYRLQKLAEEYNLADQLGFSVPE
jgi:LDH2 family malate/lactate/ureidoglycolate dehydrogenase